METLKYKLNFCFHKGYTCDSGYVCHQEEVACPPGLTCPPRPKCQKLCKVCKKFCKYGFRAGDDGCPKCECKETACEVTNIIMISLKLIIDLIVLKYSLNALVAFFFVSC